MCKVPRIYLLSFFIFYKDMIPSFLFKNKGDMPIHQIASHTNKPKFCWNVSISVYCLFFVAKRFMIKILFFQCCRSGKVSECWNSTTCGSKGNSTQCVRDSNRCNVWENKGKLMKIKLRCSNIYFIWLCYLCCGFINIFGHQLSWNE